MRPRLLALTLLAALTLGSNQFGGGSFGGASAGRVNRAPVAQAVESIVDRTGPGAFQIDTSPTTDDGDPCWPEDCTWSWAKVFDNGPGCALDEGQVTAASPTGTVTVNQTGVCVYRGTVSDGRLSDPLNVAVSVTRDQPPQVSASMVPVTEPNALTLSGSATDDSGATCGTGPSDLDCTWSPVTVPAGDAGSIGDSKAEDTTYTPTVGGGYEFQFCADDGVNDPVCDTTGLINVADSEATCVPEVAGFAHFDICAGGDDPFAAGRWDTGSTAIAAGLVTSGWPDAWQYDAAEDVIYLEATGSAVRGAAIYLTDLASVDGNGCFEVAELPSGGTWNFGPLDRAGAEADDFATYYPNVNESGQLEWASFDDINIFDTVNGPTAQAISVGDVICTRVTGEGGNETRTAYFDADYPADADPTTWTADHTFTTPDGTVSSGLARGVRAFLSATTTGRIALKDWGAGSTDPVGPVEEAVLDLTPSSCSRSMEEGETVLNCPFQVCNDGNVVLDDWAFAVQGTPNDITADGASPNSTWLGADDSDTNLAAGTCENVTATITGEENGDVGSYSGTVRASTNDADSTVATVDRTVSLTISEVGSNDFSVAIACEHEASPFAPVAIHCDAIGTTHDNASVEPVHDLHYSWSTSGCGESGNYGDSTAWGSDANAFTQRHPRNTYEGGPLFTATAYEPGSCTVHVTARDLSGGTSSTSYGPVTVSDPDTVFSGTSTTCVGRASEPTAGAGGCPSGANTVQVNSCSSISFAANNRYLFNRGENWGAPCFTNSLNGPGIIGAFGTGVKPEIGSGAVLEVGDGWRLVDLHLNASGSDERPLNIDGDDVLALRTEVTGGQRNVGITNTDAVRFAIVDSRVEDADTPSGCSYNGFTDINDRGAVVGTYIDNSMDCHNWRVPFFTKMVFVYNYLGTTEKAGFRAHGETGSTASRYGVVGYNTGNGNAQITVSTPSPNSEADIDDVIVEGNYFPQGTQAPISVMGHRMTVRNNVVRSAGQVLAQVFMRRSTDSIPHAGDHWFYHNTMFCGSGSPDMLQIDDAQAPFEGTAYAKGNLYYCPNTASPDITDGDGDWVTDSNVAIGSGGSCPFASCPPGSGAGDLDDYELNAGASGAIDGGFTMTVDDAVIRDLKGDTRSNPADAGSLER